MLNLYTEKECLTFDSLDLLIGIKKKNRFYGPVHDSLRKNVR